MVKENELISIIIPCYNTGNLIEETFTSLENQTYSNFEVILINDGSTDDTFQRIEDFKNISDLQVRTFNQENKGVSAARNRGILEAAGNYLLFLDSDDIIHPTFIERMISVKKNLDVETVYCRLSRDLRDLSEFIDENKLTLASHHQHVDDAMHNLLYEMGNYGFYCFLYSKDVLEKNKILFDENTKYGEDREFNWKYLCHCNTAGWIDLPLYGYRRHDESATSTSSWRKTDLLKAVKRTERYLKKFYPSFLQKYSDYMFPRSMWAVAKTFSVSKRLDLYKKLINEYDVHKCMKRTTKDPNILVRISSYFFMINPYFFYYLVQLK